MRALGLRAKVTGGATGLKGRAMKRYHLGERDWYTPGIHTVNGCMILETLHLPDISL